MVAGLVTKNGICIGTWVFKKNIYANNRTISLAAGTLLGSFQIYRLVRKNLRS